MQDISGNEVDETSEKTISCLQDILKSIEQLSENVSKLVHYASLNAKRESFTAETIISSITPYTIDRKGYKNVFIMSPTTVTVAVYGYCSLVLTGGVYYPLGFVDATTILVTSDANNHYLFYTCTDETLP